MKKILTWLSAKADKMMHFTASMIIALYASIVMPIAVAAILALAVGLAKEWYDSRQEGNHWCWWDIAADASGIIVAILPLIFR